MKNLIQNLLLVSATVFGLAACKEESKLPAPAIENMPIIFPEVPTGSFVNFDSLRRAVNTTGPGRARSRVSFSFSFAPNEQRDLRLEAVEVYKSYRRNTSWGPRVLVGTYNSFPATVTLTGDALLAGLRGYNGESFFPVQLANPNAFNILIQQNDAVVFTFEYIAEGGRRIILTPLNSVGAPTGTFINDAFTAAAVIRRP